MAIIINDNFAVNVGKPVDSKYMNISAPWTSISAANTGIPLAYRYQGLTVNINGVEYWYKNGVADVDLIIKTAGSGAGTVSGATNGLHLINSGTTVALGGTLTGNTIINANSHDFCVYDVRSISLESIVSGYSSTFHGYNTDICGTNFLEICSPQVQIDFSSFGRVNDNSGTKCGLVYGGNYDATFVARSLVDKCYVDTVATGLQPKVAVWVATTGTSISLSGNQLIDGVMTVNGMRVLVKNQSGNTTPAVDNGIYIASSSFWTRSPDFDGTPQGEIQQGALIPVLSGITNRNSLWVLITPDPITGGTTPLLFTPFSTPGNYVGGTGIDVIGNTISINTPTYAIITNAITGATTGLGTDGNRNVCLDSTTQAILADAITGATNGLGTDGNRNVCLGGILIAPTTIDLSGQIFTVCGAIGNAFIELNDSSFAACFGTNCVSTTELHNNLYNLTLSSAPFAVFHDNNCIGLCYDGDYEANFVNRSLVTKQYVLGQITGFTGTITGGTNGLGYSAANICLGGTLIATTDISGAQDLSFGGITPLTSFGVIATTDFKLTVCSNKATIALDDTGKAELMGGRYASISLSANTAMVQVSASTANILGTVRLLTIPNAGAISDTLLVWNSGDKEVKCLSISTITGATAISANNGLTKAGNIISLGGNLTGTTTIIQTGNTFSICTTSIGSTPRLIMNPSSTCTELGMYCNSTCRSAIYSYGAGLPTTGIYSIGGTSCSSIISDIKLSLNSCNGSCGTTVCLDERGLYYCVDYSSRWNTCRYIPDINYVTGCTVNLISCYSNIDNIRNITSGTTTTAIDNFVGVDITGSRCVYLYATPKYGQKLTIVDVRGDALSFPITIDGNGNLINGGQCALINTDYGSITFVFNCSNFWSAVAFVN
jgi:hypothetical protein